MAEKNKTKKKDKKGKARDPKNPYGNYEFDRSKKVTQATVDMIKDTARKDGIEAAIKKHGGSNAEAVKRLYGQRRYDLYATKGSSSSARTAPRDEKSGKDMKRMSAGPKMGGGQGYKGAKSASTKSSTRQKIGAAAAGAAALYTTAYQQAKKPATGVISGRARANPKLPAGRTARTAYNAAIKAGKTPAAALTAAKGAVKKAAAMPVSKRKAALSTAGRAGARLLGPAAAPVLAYDALNVTSKAARRQVAKTKGGKEALARYDRSGGPAGARVKQMAEMKRRAEARKKARGK
jgi:hypothetical protein